MIVRAIDGRFVGHPFFLSIQKERPWQRLSQASKHVPSEFFIHLCRAPPLSRCLCRAQALSVSGPGPAARAQGSLFVSWPGGASAVSALSVSGPGALRVPGPALSVSGSVLGTGGPLPTLCLSLSPAVSASGPGPFGALQRSLCPRSLRQAPQRFPDAFCVGPPWSLCRPSALYVGARRSLCQARRSLCGGSAIWFSVSGALRQSTCQSPGALYVGARRSSLRRGRPGALCVGPALSVSGPDGLCVGAGRSWCRGPALSVSGPSALCVGARHSLCRGPGLQRSVSGPSLCRGPAVAPRSGWLSELFDVGAQHSLSQRSLCRAPTVFVSGPSTPTICVSVLSSLCVLCSRPALFSRPQLTHPILRAHAPPRCAHLLPQPELPCVLPPIRSAAHAPIRVAAIRVPPTQLRAPSSDPRATHPVSRCQLRPMPPIQPRAHSSDPCPSHPARRVPFFQDRTPNLTVWGNRIELYLNPIFRIKVAEIYIYIEAI